MSEKYDNTNSGALFRNDRKEKETQPDLRGKINVDGKDFYISAWSKQSEKAGKYMSLALTPVDEKATATADSTSDPF
jgi:uncharacterized protein (DUF736 family)